MTSVKPRMRKFIYSLLLWRILHFLVRGILPTSKAPTFLFWVVHGIIPGKSPDSKGQLALIGYRLQFCGIHVEKSLGNRRRSTFRIWICFEIHIFFCLFFVLLLSIKALKMRKFGQELFCTLFLCNRNCSQK